MGNISKFARIDRMFAWSFLGFVLAVIFGGIALYTTFIRDLNPVIKYHVIANTKILDVKEDVGGLAIIYNNEDIRKSQKTLSVVTLKVVNDGRSAVLKTYYDSASPLGFTISSGEIIRGEIISASTPYLRSNARVKIADPKTGHFSEVILEPGEWFTVKCLVLNPENVTLSVAPKGKVASVNKLTLIDELTKEVEEPFWARVVSGSPVVQLVRVPIYFFGFILALLIIFGPIAIISDSISKRHRRKIIMQFKSYSNSKYDDINAPLYQLYENFGIGRLVELRQVVSDDKKFGSSLKKYLASANKGHSDYTLEDSSSVIEIGPPMHHRKSFNYPPLLFRNLITLGVVVKEGETFRKDEQKVKAMNEFIDFALIKQS